MAEAQDPAAEWFDVVKSGHIPDIEIELEKGADVNQQDDEGNTALHIVVGQYTEKWIEVVNVLMEYGADTLVRNERKDIPLHVVVWSINTAKRKVYDIIDRLLLCADKEVALRQLYAVNKKKRTPEQEIRARKNCEKSRNDLEVWLKKRRDDLEQVFKDAKAGGLTRFMPHIEEGGCVNQRDHEGNTLLLCASKTGQVATVRYLLAAGADRLMPNDNGDVPLHVAVRHNTNHNVRNLLMSALGARGKQDELMQKQLQAHNNAGATPISGCNNVAYYLNQPPSYAETVNEEEAP